MLLLIAPLFDALLAPPDGRPQMFEPLLPVPRRGVRNVVVVAHKNLLTGNDVLRGHDAHDEAEPETISKEDVNAKLYI